MSFHCLRLWVLGSSFPNGQQTKKYRWVDSKRLKGIENGILRYPLKFETRSGRDSICDCREMNHRFTRRRLHDKTGALSPLLIFRVNWTNPIDPGEKFIAGAGTHQLPEERRPRSPCWDQLQWLSQSSWCVWWQQGVTIQECGQISMFDAVKSKITCFLGKDQQQERNPWIRLVALSWHWLGRDGKQSQSHVKVRKEFDQWTRDEFDQRTTIRRRAWSRLRGSCEKVHW
jgi:hypothetical protein